MLVFSAPYKFKSFDEPFHFSDKSFLISKKLNSYLEDSKIEHWKDWIGSLRWDEVSNGCREILCSWEETSAPDILNKENKTLSNINFEILRTLPTVTPYCFIHSMDIYSLTGTAEKLKNEIKILDIRQFSTIPSFKKSMFLDPDQCFEDPFFDHHSVMNLWRDTYIQVLKKIFAQEQRQLLEAYRSIVESFQSWQLEFKIPNLVRSIECLIDCHGADDFVKKISFFIDGPPDESIFKIRENFSQKLKNIYQLRNDCSHGKDFGWSLKRNHPAEYSPEGIAAYEYLTEWTARKVFNRALFDDKLGDMFKSRENLVSSWKKTKAE